MKELPSYIGGPNTSLPMFAETFLSWGLCSSCLAMQGYYYGKTVLLSSGWYFNIYHSVRTLVRTLFGGLICSMRYMHPLMDSALADHEDEATWIPLTTHSRAEVEKCSPWERYLSLLRLFEKCHPEVLTPIMMPTQNGYYDSISGRRLLPNMESFESIKCNADAALIHVLRHNDMCRRLASLAMRPYDPTMWKPITGANDNCHIHGTDDRDTFPHTTTLLRQFPHNRLLQRMAKYWKDLLVLPSLEEVHSFYHLPATPSTPVAFATNRKHINDVNYRYRISLILPAYCEKGCHLLSKLTKALEMACEPSEVEVIVVDAGGCSDLELLLPLVGDITDTEYTKDGHVNQYYGRVSIFSYNSGGGRGPCLNFGAYCATGCVLTFLHADTIMPAHWDEKIVTTLEQNEGMCRNKVTRANSCAFSFGIDTSPEGLSMPFEPSVSTYCPRGVRAVEFFTNLRNRLFSLPYGDQVISLHACVFHFLGGFPDQCLMEDYELVCLLRRRAALFVSPVEHAPSGTVMREKIAIISGAPALCSPRRWQKFGVLYVTFMNHKFVNLYAGRRKIGPDDLFKQYYGQEAPKREAVDSPWEVELANVLDS